jgi:hypothetical protein
MSSRSFTEQIMAANTWLVFLLSPPFDQGYPEAHYLMSGDTPELTGRPWCVHKWDSVIALSHRYLS